MWARRSTRPSVRSDVKHPQALLAHEASIDFLVGHTPGRTAAGTVHINHRQDASVRDSWNVKSQTRLPGSFPRLKVTRIHRRDSFVDHQAVLGQLTHVQVNPMPLYLATLMNDRPRKTRALNLGVGAGAKKGSDHTLSFGWNRKTTPAAGVGCASSENSEHQGHNEFMSRTSVIAPSISQ